LEIGINAILLLKYIGLVALPFTFLVLFQCMMNLPLYLLLWKRGGLQLIALQNVLFTCI